MLDSKLKLKKIFNSVKITFVKSNGDRIEATGKVGDSILDIVVNNEIDLDGYGKYFIFFLNESQSYWKVKKIEIQQFHSEYLYKFLWVGACEGTLTCSTCHLIFPRKVYDMLPDKPTDEELDMLDLAYDLTDT